MHEEIVGIIREVCGKDIDEDMSLFGDLQMDSVEMIELVLRIEEKYLFDFESYDELMNHMDTVKDLSLIHIYFRLHDTIRDSLSCRLWHVQKSGYF